MELRFCCLPEKNKPLDNYIICNLIFLMHLESSVNKLPNPTVWSAYKKYWISAI